MSDRAARFSFVDLAVPSRAMQPRHPAARGPLTLAHRGAVAI
jgi:hypothetical protein